MKHSNQKGIVSVTYNLAPAGKYKTWNIRVYYSLDYKSGYEKITDECTGYVGAGVQPGKYRGLVWNVLNHRPGLQGSTVYIKLEALYETVGKVTSVDMGVVEEYPEYDTGGPEIAEVDGLSLMTPMSMQNQRGTYRLQFLTRITNNSERRYINGGRIEVSLVTADGTVLTQRGVLRRFDNDNYIGDWLNQGHYRNVYANIDFGNIEVDRVLYADISFNSGLEFHITNFDVRF